ncbi:MAG: hypothetical protein ABI549_13480, partial [Flavobacterium sp.]|uniref:hypothetical protein n=1 Tax=Flavobacterium sp. TaxID=239 RepID=UPI0032645D94
MKDSASKSISAPAEIILKCLVPEGATMIFEGMNEAKSTLICPIGRLIVATKGANKLVPSFQRILNSKPLSNSTLPSITFRKP